MAMTIDVASPGRRGGRPRAIEPRTTVTTWIATREHDALIKEAQQRGVSVSALVRETLTARRGSLTRKP